MTKQICWAVDSLEVLALCELRHLKFVFSLKCKILTVFIAQSHTQSHTTLFLKIVTL